MNSIADSWKSPEPKIEADYSKFDSVEDIIRDAAQWGLLEELREKLCGKCDQGRADKMQIARDIAFEFAGAKNRDLAVDLFVHVTQIAEFGPASLRDYGQKHGCSYEWFRREAEAMRERLNLPALLSTGNESVPYDHAA
jgi:hypothetical protein